MPSLIERHRKVLPSWMPLYYEDPIALVRGEGRHVWDHEGRKYLDFYAGILTTMAGHAVPEIVEAIRDQAGSILHSSTLYMNEPQIELAEEIARLSGIPDARVFFTTSGTEANDTALMLSTGMRKSNQVLAIRNSYHGRSFSTLAITGNRSWSPSSLSPLNVSYVLGGYRYHTPFRDYSDEEYMDLCCWDLRNTLETATSGDVACMIAEPIQGVGGFVVPPDGFFGRYKEILDENGILFVSDEVQTGWGRTGEHFWGYQAHGIVPDLMTFAKGVGNGLSLGGLVGRAEVFDSLGIHSISTFGGNPLVSAGALATIRYIQKNELQANALSLGNRMRKRLDALAENCDLVGEVRGKGLMQALELVDPRTGEPNGNATSALLEETKAMGLLIGRGGLYGNVVRISPPLSLTPAECDEGTELLEKAIARVAARAL